MTSFNVAAPPPAQQITTPDDSQLVDSILGKMPDVLAIYRFGSSGTGDEHPGSDIDLAVLCRQTITPEQLWDIAQNIALALGQDVDLIDLRAASTVMRAQVLAHGRCIHGALEKSVVLFEGFVLSDYARLNEERSEIIKEIKLRGSIYG